MAYFTGEHEGGEVVSFAVCPGTEPTQWTTLDETVPPIASKVGERGLRDPFLLRDTLHERFVILATDLRIAPDGDWARSVRHGSRSIAVLESRDLVTWTEPRLVTVSPPEAGNTWAPKAFWDAEEQCWLVLWASALYARGDDRQVESTQRMLCARTTDFETFSEPEVYLEDDHSVIDMTFLSLPDGLLRLSKQTRDGTGLIVAERGTDVHGRFEPLETGVGSAWMVHAEGPAVARSSGTDRSYLILDEHGLRGCLLFASDDPFSRPWEPVPDAVLPPGSRHCSMLAVDEAELARLVP